jgi:hypothetical protein
VLKGQDVVLHHPQLQYVFADSIAKVRTAHSVFAPYIVAENAYNQYFYGDTLSHHFIKKTSVRFTVDADPVVDASFLYDQQSGDFLPQFGLGMRLSGNLGNKVGWDFSGEILHQAFAKAVTDSISALNLVPGFDNELATNGRWATFGMLRGSAWWNANRYMTFKAGNDKQFWGDGHRSLFLSENAAAYPYVQMDIHLWKIKYVFQTLFLRDLEYGQGSARSPKYISMHQLNYSVCNRLDVYAFEALVWCKEDSLRYRNIDMHYLNPFIFFRPVEYNVGSPDNMLFGAGGRLRIFQKTYLYGQLLLDEFRMKELVANNGWWGNKYGVQAGFKTYGLTRKYPSILLLEINHVTPFTYSHTSSMENYGYLRSPLAHPRGTNFDEALMVFRMSLNRRHSLHFTSVVSRFGTNIPGENDGGDIYAGMWMFKNLYGNKTGQGVTTYEAEQSLQYSYLVSPAWRLNAFFTISSLERRLNGTTTVYPSVNFGLKTLLYQ